MQIVHKLCRVIVGAVDACVNVVCLGEARSMAILDMLLFVNQSATLASKEFVAELWPRYDYSCPSRRGVSLGCGLLMVSSRLVSCLASIVT